MTSVFLPRFLTKMSVDSRCRSTYSCAKEKHFWYKHRRRHVADHHRIKVGWHGLQKQQEHLLLSSACSLTEVVATLTMTDWSVRNPLFAVRNGAMVFLQVWEIAGERVGISEWFGSTWEKVWNQVKTLSEVWMCIIRRQKKLWPLHHSWEGAPL